jgi:hypothetical protein
MLWNLHRSAECEVVDARILCHRSQMLAVSLGALNGKGSL